MVWSSQLGQGGGREGGMKGMNSVCVGLYSSGGVLTAGETRLSSAHH